MLRYIKHNLTGIDGIEIFPLISLLIFVLFFTFVLLYVMKMKKNDVNDYSSLPLEDEPTEDFIKMKLKKKTSKISHIGAIVVMLITSTALFGQTGEGLFKSKCNVCHMLEKDGTGPNLKGAKQKWEDAGELDFLYEWVRNSEALISSGKSSRAKEMQAWSPTMMTAQDVSNEQIDAILDYVDNYVAPVETGGTNVAGDEPVIKVVPNYQTNLLLFYFLIGAIIFQLIAILVMSYSTKTIVAYKNEKDKSNGNGVKMIALLVILGGMTLTNQSLALNFIQAGEAPDMPWLLVENSDIYVLVAVNVVLLFVLLHFRKLFLDIAHIVRPERMERISKRRQRKMNKILTDAVPIEEEHTILMHHEYDGIKELDNNLPPWWVWGFYATIAFAIIYLFHYHILGTGDLQAAEYNKSIVQAEAETAAYLEKMAMNVDENNVTLLTEDKDMSTGKTLFETNCVTCHNPKGEGNQIGPNLTDKNWIYGYDIKEVFTTVKYGRPNGMPEHNSKLNPVQLQQVSSYILSLPPADGREPQGDIIEQ